MMQDTPPGKPRRSFVRESPEQRRAELIEAALELIGEGGYRAATVRSIAARANVSLGLIRHHFSTKEDLINAAYEAHMSEMTELSLALADRSDLAPKARMASVIRASLSPPVMSERNVTLWATFIAQIANEPAIKATHDRTYLEFRDRLEDLISQTLAAEDRPATPLGIRHLALACNALMDGLWLEGGACPGAVEGADLAAVGLEKIGLILGVDLSAGGGAA
ncbi:TetR/AcrR family transcriptional regulator [Pseudooceanicola algae]|uniref:HTH-type transcriptional regulator BetI n=1 Tax=Pseudooceanicola algae TaxID=1537215 RepID=A0A418SD18_9RHOB|nr:TetR family transcriptional regulator [Pseudooceanicola algae]QPM92356.1 HTH-type transcriptional regulator BetI [Pseudooceanicola algae]